MSSPSVDSLGSCACDSEISWRPNWARGPEKNIRTWGQLGLTGEWADKPINVYGLTLRYHQATEISDRVLKASDKWNERLKIYANFVSKAGKLERGMNEDLAADKCGSARCRWCTRRTDPARFARPRGS
ncbi:MAG: hypothetical protein E6H69_11840 [Betaproteobacteria bacterium]|nr:MAG: hypothetical protein E6H69_11840 [Betaproteobacteria bacterium]